MRLDFGIPVRCADEVVGKTADVVVDPSTRLLTHVVVKTRDDVVRLVPAGLVVPGREGRREIDVTCTAAELDAFEPIRRLAYLGVDEFPAPDAESDVGVEERFSIVYSEPVELGDYVAVDDAGLSVTYDRIPKGEAELRRSSEIACSDGHSLGGLVGLVVEGASLTQLVAQRGHLWWAREVAIPIDSVQTIATDSVTLSLTKAEVEALGRP